MMETIQAYLPTLIKASYFLAAILFITGLRRMSAPGTARGGIVWAGVGMLIATIATFLLPDMHNMVLIIAALASGWGANWLSSWVAFDRPLLGQTLGLAGHEWVAGFIHLGTETAVPPERPRPDAPALTTWISA